AGRGERRGKLDGKPGTAFVAQARGQSGVGLERIEQVLVVIRHGTQTPSREEPVRERAGREPRTGDVERAARRDPCEEGAAAAAPAPGRGRYSDSRPYACCARLPFLPSTPTTSTGPWTYDWQASLTSRPFQRLRTSASGLRNQSASENFSCCGGGVSFWAPETGITAQVAQTPPPPHHFHRPAPFSKAASHRR